MVLDGSERTDELIKSAIAWDTPEELLVVTGHVMSMLLRHAIEYNRLHQGTDHITIPYLTDEDLVKESVKKLFE